jgi:cysteinyl-tRNA synthetase
MKYLGETFDIHTGGVDNLFPHHENEIAQSEGATGKKFVNYWLHCEHLLWDNTKMSKSLGNIMYINGLIEKGYTPAAIRYALLTTHYRQKLNFNLEILDAAESTLKRIDNFLFTLKDAKAGDADPEVKKIIDTMLEKFEDAMDDDLNISGAVGVIFDAIKKMQRIFQITPSTDATAALIDAGLHSADEVLGVIYFRDKVEAKVDEALIVAKIAERNEARANKDWAKADEIRDELDAMGVELLDRKDGTGYKIKN